MSKLKIGIVEDEMIIASNIANTLEVIGYEVTNIASSYMEALEMLDKEKPDLVLLDINIKGKKDGIDIAWKIREDYDIPFIFLTANADTATLERAKLTEPPAYLVKPFTKDDLYTSIEISIHNHSKKQATKKVVKETDNYVIKDSLFIKEANYFHKVKFADILYLESEHVYVYVHTTDKKIMVRTSMQQYLDNFDQKKFFRIHRSYVINLDHIQTINTENIVVNNVTLPIGKTFRNDLLSHIKLG
jgi:two-component system, LytTR family, response regulator LytT